LLANIPSEKTTHIKPRMYGLWFAAGCLNQTGRCSSRTQACPMYIRVQRILMLFLSRAFRKCICESAVVNKQMQRRYIFYLVKGSSKKN